MLEVKNVNVFYGDLQVLWDISLTVSEGELVAVVGSNGSGKTTLLHTILGLRPPTPKSGHINFLGKEIHNRWPWEIVRMGISLVPEGRRVFRNMNVIENLLMGCQKGLSKEEKSELLKEIFDLFPRLKERKKQLAGTLSGGERQMLVIGRGLMSTPKLLLLDEPSLGLAPKLVFKIFEAIKKIHEEGVTIVLSDQNIYHALELADRGYVLEMGRISLEGDKEELFESEKIKKKYLGI